MPFYLIPIPSEPDYGAEFQHFLRGAEQTIHTITLPKYEGMTNEQVESMLRLAQLPAFEGLLHFVKSKTVSRV